MQNPTYLSLSRHNIYYFRWPVPQSIIQDGKAKHIKLSLHTREPKEALQLANILSYYARILTTDRMLNRMNYGDVVNELREYFYELINEKKDEIYRTGPLDPKEIDKLVDEVQLCAHIWCSYGQHFT